VDREVEQDKRIDDAPSTVDSLIDGVQEEETIQFRYSFGWFVLPALIGCGVGTLVLCVLSFFWLPLLAGCLLPIGYGTYVYFLWQSTIYTILPNRIIHRHGIFLPEEDEIYFQDIRKRKKKIEIPGTDIGSIFLETAAQSTNNANLLEGDVVIKNIENVTIIYELIVELERGVRGSFSRDRD
jgi:hypothetical protein